jgi:UDP-glucuronate 4-epimerase
MRILVTGAAGFIGFHTAARLLDRGDEVVGLDNLSPYYDVSLKEARLSRLKGRNGFHFIKTDLAEREVIEAVFAEEKPDRVIHLAAQAGVRYSLVNPRAYIAANVVGQLEVLEACRQLPHLRHLVTASTSSVYGGNTKLPFAVTDRVDTPHSLYAATKKADELMSHCYAHLYRLPVTALRFFTVYGPWGRPDMAAWLFTEAILAGRPIRVFE